eukprot:CAMPEP_0172713560 /NCGR_PEP_ID=MMETSP1074-20121228/62855_1 /TAXON_ID=2916 /ORGANISM="Ceratium fusus, Strain PA161109" /LENGTH=65 /DNA_ID=CAMNT_0013537691 /DNA_START=440 /DNA_END=633 /DNA_ORIENTATION=+
MTTAHLASSRGSNFAGTAVWVAIMKSPSLQSSDWPKPSVEPLQQQPGNAAPIATKRVRLGPLRST